MKKLQLKRARDERGVSLVEIMVAIVLLGTAVMSLASADAIFMHDLPAHRGEEIVDDVIEGPQSVVFDQAENRLHAQRAVLLLLLGKEGE